MHLWIPLSLVLLHASPLPLDSRLPAEQPATKPSPPHAHEPQDESRSALCPICPDTRDGGGTSWQPDGTTEAHRHWTAAGSWHIAAHAVATLAAVRQGGPRGDDGAYGVNHAMVQARRRLGAGVLGIQSMWSLEPTMGARGYPLLLQTGETADGVNTLVDRQHPHDLPMELAATYGRALAHERAIFVYAAAAGAPALGPPAYMHRASGSLLPFAPITHHWLDSTHVSYGVVTGGFVASPRVRFEGSVFRGREPDQHHWGFERPGLDSYAFRLSVNPTASLAVQVSAGVITDPEQTHPDADVARLTASALYSRRWRAVSLDATAAWGRNNRSASTIPVPGGVYFYAGSVTQAFLAEATLRLGRHAAVTRMERVSKDELFPLLDPRHALVFPVARLSAGYVLGIVDQPRVTVQLGAAAAWSPVDAALEGDYSSAPRSGLLFLRVAAH
jgi:hypothetical protein